MVVMARARQMLTAMVGRRVRVRVNVKARFMVRIRVKVKG